MSPEHPKVLVVDDEKAMRTVLRERLSRFDLEVRMAADAAEAIALIESFRPDLAVCDVMLPDAGGLDVLAALHHFKADMPVIMITAHGSVDLAVEAMKAGAVDFLTKPLDHDRLRQVIDENLPSSRRPSLDATPENDSAGTGATSLGAAGGPISGTAELLPGLLGASDAMVRAASLVKESANTGVPVLITGESGTGKELVARAIHRGSVRRRQPFVPINAAAIPRELMESEIFGHEKGAFTGAVTTRQGCFELADEGTLFLDEIGEMPLELQPKLLRVLEDGRVRRLGASEEVQFDVRLVSATNRATTEAMAEGRLREDLFYRLSVFHIELPPLRERGDDVELLAQHFVARFNQEYGASVEGFEPAALSVLRSYPWPGNVRELQNVVQRSVVLTKTGSIGVENLPGRLTDEKAPPGDADLVDVEVGLSVAEAERRLILKTLEAVGNNKAEAARQLGLDVKTVRNKLKAYGTREA